MEPEGSAFDAASLRPTTKSTAPPSHMRRQHLSRTALVSLLTLSISTAAAAERWVPVDGAGPDLRYVDLDGVVLDGATATIWLRTNFAYLGKKGAASSLEKWMFECSRSQAKLLAVTMYKANGVVIGSGESPRYLERWTDVPPQSSLRVVYERVCGAIRRAEKGPAVSPVETY